MENELLENINTDTTNDVSDENVVDDVIQEEEKTSIDALADYYDYYYSEVLSNLNVVTSQQQTIIKNQEAIISTNAQVLTSLNLITFILAIILITQVLRNMIKKF